MTIPGFHRLCCGFFALAQETCAVNRLLRRRQPRDREDGEEEWAAMLPGRQMTQPANPST